MDVVYPSTRRYRDRLELANSDTFLYNSMYNSMRQSDVWGRLTTDASLRQTSVRSRPSSAWQEGQASGRYSWKSSGFDSNTTPPVYTKTTFKQGYYQDGQPIEQQHKITALRYKKKHPVDFMTQIRPDTETTNQAMRMLGTYDSDRLHTERLGVFIPQVCPGGKSTYHADVRTGGYGLMPTLPRSGLGATLQDGKNLK